MGQMFAPGAAALAAGALAQAALGEAWVAVLAGAVGAVALSIAFSRTEDILPEPSGRPPRRGGEGAVEGELPVGLGRTLLAQMPLGMLLVARDGRLEFMNAAAVELFGRRPAASAHASALRAPKLLDAIDATLGENISSTVHFSLTRANGGLLHLRGHVRQVEAGALFVDRRRGALALVVIEDETRGRRAEELHRDFVANASHELKTPLAALSGLIETLQGHAREDPEAAERFLAMMAGQTERMKRLVEDLLSLNRIEVNERVQPREPQDLWRIVSETVELLGPILRDAEMTVERAPPAGPLTVLGHEDELGQVFRNLLENAVKYAGPRGTVRIESHGPEAGEPGMAGVSVVDDGPGIPREHIPRLTERFYRVSVSRSRQKGGTGLGLAIVKHVVKRHRGRLDIESEPGEGTRFTVWLPRAAGADAAEAPRGRRAPAA
jgi:two-component system phosphate regulon sensor histidine kinase PhoR